MKKLYITSIALTQLFLNANAQTSGYLESGNIRAGIHPNGMLFNTLTSSGYPDFEYPKGSGHHAIYTANLNIGGTTASADIRTATANLTSSDFQPGPIMFPGSYAIRSPYWNRVWKITADEINNHIANYATSGYVVPPVIADWPANGDPIYGEPVVVAPYVDVNINGTYDPENGDYPSIYGTEAIFQVYNDDTIHTSGGSVPMNLEIKLMAYTLACNDSALNNTIFLHYEIINRGTQTFYSSATSFFADFDLGDYTDDYIGTDVARGTVYCFNADSNDGIYGTTLPMFGITVLGGPYADTDFMANQFASDYASMVANNDILYSGQGLNYGDTIIDNERKGLTGSMAYTGSGALAAGISDPVTGPEYYNYMNNLWRDGSSLFYGGTGYPSLSGVSSTVSNYAFISDSDPMFLSTQGTAVTPDWREDIAANTPGDRRCFTNSGNIVIAPGEYNFLDIAITAATDYTTTGTPLAALPILQNRIDSLRSYFISNTSPCGPLMLGNYLGVKDHTENAFFALYPNPASTILNVTLNSKAVSSKYSIMNAFGQNVLHGFIENNNARIDIDALPGGLYFLTVMNNVEASSKPFVITK